MTSIQEGTHIEQSHPAKTFNCSHPLNVFAEQPILTHEKVPDVRGIARYLKKGPINIVYGSNV